ncbi:MAG: DUF2165 family protein [Pseudomonadota bacterium]
METLELVGLTGLVGLLAGWLTLGALENIRFPEVNRALVRDVLSMTRVSQEQPQIYELTKGNRIASDAVHRILFAIIVAVECLAAGLLIWGTAALALAAAGLADPVSARIVAGSGTILFTLIWGAFLVGGQWVHYWAAWKDSQFTHYFMTIWGAVTFIALT